MSITYSPVLLKNPRVAMTVDFHPDASEFVIGQDSDEDQLPTLTVLDSRSRTAISEIEKSDFGLVLKARYTYGGRYLAYVGATHQAKLYDDETKSTKVLDVPDLSLDWLSCVKKGPYCLLAGALTYVFDVHRQKLIWTSSEEGAVAVVYEDRSAIGALDPNHPYVAVAGVEKDVITVYDFLENSLVQYLPGGPKHAALDIAYDPTGRYLAVIAAERPRPLLLWDMTKGEKYPTDPDLGDLLCLGFHPTGSYLALGMSSGALAIIKLADRKVAFLKSNVHDRRVWGIAFSADGKQMVSAGEGGAFLWDTSDLA